MHSFVDWRISCQSCRMREHLSLFASVLEQKAVLAVLLISKEHQKSWFANSEMNVHCLSSLSVLWFGKVLSCAQAAQLRTCTSFRVYIAFAWLVPQLLLWGCFRTIFLCKSVVLMCHPCFKKSMKITPRLRGEISVELHWEKKSDVWGHFIAWNHTRHIQKKSTFSCLYICTPLPIFVFALGTEFHASQLTHTLWPSA